MSYDDFCALCQKCWQHKYGFLVIDKDSSMNNGRYRRDVALEKQFKPISESLKQLVQNTIDVESDVSKIEPFDILEKDHVEKKIIKVKKRPRISYNDLSSKQKRLNVSLNDLPITSTPNQRRTIPDTSTQIEIAQPRQLSYEQPPVDEIFETTPDSLVTTVQRELQTSAGVNIFREHLGPLGQKYILTVMNQDKDKAMDYVYGIKFSNDGIMLGDKHFDVDKNDNIIINEVKYTGTPGLYELIFKKIPDDEIYTEDDLLKYKSILLATNAHKRGNKAHNPVLGTKGYKYKNVIAPLLSSRKAGKGILPRAMTLNDNKIDYVHWNDPNELVDRLRLLDASRRAGNNAHDNEIMSIIEELREDGLIIN
ncbi:uncharacterized protein [Anoplolepis gracilipes]|uniref:uncharacterized protein n=1 Tax=Anoplolepis gracilipes TaxID=354296 RepID=UPI003BA3A00C